MRSYLRFLGRNKLYAAIYLLLDLMKQTPYANNIDTFWWVYVAAILISIAISLASVLWQTLRAASANPAEALKKE